jgi:hypothetical protein
VCWSRPWYNVISELLNWIICKLSTRVILHSICGNMCQVGSGRAVCCCWLSLKQETWVLHVAKCAVLLYRLCCVRCAKLQDVIWVIFIISTGPIINYYTTGSILVCICGFNQKYYSTYVSDRIWYLFSAERFLPGGSGR